MDYRNLTPFPSLAFEALDPQNQTFRVVVARTTLKIQADGTLHRAEEQKPLIMTDEFYGESGKSSVKQESDLAPHKPWCDVIVIGNAAAPGGKPVTRFEAGVRVSRKGDAIVTKRVRVTGSRYWEKKLFGWTLTEPSKIRSLPLRYEYAYGGECRVETTDPKAKSVPKKYRLTEEQRKNHPLGAEKAPVAHGCCAANPLGLGYVEKWYLKASKLKRIPAPQIESPLEPIEKFGQPYAPQGLGVIGRAWTTRHKLCGTMDENFIRSGRSLPDDFDFGYWNGAHPDLQLPWLQGDETIDLINIPVAEHRGARVDSRGDRVTRLILPGKYLCGLAYLEDGQMSARDFRIDTLIVDAEEQTVSLTYRLQLPADLPVQSLDAEYLSEKERGVLVDHVESVNREVLKNRSGTKKPFAKQ